MKRIHLFIERDAEPLPHYYSQEPYGRLDVWLANASEVAWRFSVWLRDLSHRRGFVNGKDSGCVKCWYLNKVKNYK